MARSRQDTILVIDVVIDETIYPRAVFNQIHARRLLDAFDAGTTFPPIIVERGFNRLVDGRHRLWVYQQREIERIPATARVFASEADIFAEAVRLNISHGAQLTHYDVRSAVMRLEQFGYTHERIAEVTRILPDKVGEIIKGFAKSEAGEPVVLKGGLHHKRSQVLTHGQQMAVRKYAGGQATHHIRQLILLLESQMWPHESAMARVEMERLIVRWREIYPTTSSEVEEKAS